MGQRGQDSRCPSNNTHQESQACSCHILPDQVNQLCSLTSPLGLLFQVGFFPPTGLSLKELFPNLMDAAIPISLHVLITSEPAQCKASSSSEIKTCHCTPAWQRKEEYHVWDSAGWHTLLWKGFWDSVPLLYLNLNRKRPTRDIPELRFVKLSLTAG